MGIVRELTPMKLLHHIYRHKQHRLHEYLRFHILYKHYFQHISDLDNKIMPFSVKKKSLSSEVSFFFIT